MRPDCRDGGEGRSSKPCVFAQQKRPEPISVGSGRTKHCPWFHLNSPLEAGHFVPGNTFRIVSHIYSGTCFLCLCFKPSHKRFSGAPIQFRHKHFISMQKILSFLGKHGPAASASAPTSFHQRKPQIFFRVLHNTPSLGIRHPHAPTGLGERPCLFHMVHQLRHSRTKSSFFSKHPHLHMIMQLIFFHFSPCPPYIPVFS